MSLNSFKYMGPEHA